MLMLREARNRKGLTLKQVGDLLGISESTLSQYENGKREASYETILKLGELYDCSVDYLLRGNQNESEISQDMAENIYFRLAKEAEESGIDPDDIRMAIDMVKRIKGI